MADQASNLKDDMMAERIAAGCFEDPGMRHCQWDSTAAIAISAILRMVLRENKSRRGMTHAGELPGARSPQPSRPVGEQPVVGKA